MRSIPVKSVFYEACRRFHREWVRKFLMVCYRWRFNEIPVKKIPPHYERTKWVFVRRVDCTTLSYLFKSLTRLSFYLKPDSQNINLLKKQHFLTNGIVALYFARLQDQKLFVIIMYAEHLITRNLFQLHSPVHASAYWCVVFDVLRVPVNILRDYKRKTSLLWS